MSRGDSTSGLMMALVFIVGALILMTALLSIVTVYEENDPVYNFDITESSYIIYKDGDYTCAKNGTTGRIEMRQTDASSVLQHAVDSAPNNGTVYFASGNYSFSSAVYLNRTASIIGAGVGTPMRYHNVTALCYEGTGDFIVAYAGAIKPNCAWTISNLKIFGNDLANNGINFTYASYGGFDNVEISGFGGSGAFINGGVGVKIENSVFWGNGEYGINQTTFYTPVGGEYGYLITGCVFHGNTKGNLAIGLGSIQVSDCVFENSAGITSDHIKAFKESSGGSAILIDNCIFANSGASGSVYTNSAINITEAEVVTVTSSHFNGHYYGILITKASRAIISDNSFGLIDGFAVYNAGSNDLIISNNYVKLERPTGGGIKNAGSYDVIISGNEIVGSTSTGAVSRGDSPGILNSGAIITIQGNIISGAVEGINNTGSSVLIEGNYIYYTVKYAIVTGAGYVSIINNFINYAGFVTANTYSAIYLSEDVSSTDTPANTFIQGNRIEGGAKSKYLIEKLNYQRNIVIYGNYLNNAATSPISVARTDDSVRDNYGYFTSGSGTATLLSGTSTIVVTHRLSAAPESVIVTSSADVGDVWITSISATQFTINVDTAPGSNVVIYWEAFTASY